MDNECKHLNFTTFSNISGKQTKCNDCKEILEDTFVDYDNEKAIGELSDKIGRITSGITRGQSELISKFIIDAGYRKSNLVPISECDVKRLLDEVVVFSSSPVGSQSGESISTILTRAICLKFGSPSQNFVPLDEDSLINNIKSISENCTVYGKNGKPMGEFRIISENKFELLAKTLSNGSPAKIEEPFHFVGYKTSELIKAINWCKQHGFDIVNDPSDLKKPWIDSKTAKIELPSLEEIKKVILANEWRGGVSIEKSKLILPGQIAEAILDLIERKMR